MNLKEAARSAAHAHCRKWPGSEKRINHRFRHFKQGFLEGAKWAYEDAIRICESRRDMGNPRTWEADLCAREIRKRMSEGDE